MKPLSLQLRGIGPFVETQHLDFSLLDERALFLIHGPTGQGKSFIFDALCYALYADTPSNREGHLKSDFLADGIEPSVDFTFALGAIHYRIRRTLRYERPKKRGDGTTTQDDSHYLAVFDSDGSERVLAEKRTEVDARIRELMGLDAGQFRQVVMIPQGEFRKLLLSDSAERENLLEQLFDAVLFREVQEQLQEQEDEIRNDFEIHKQKVERLVFERDDLCRAEELILPEDTDDVLLSALNLLAGKITGLEVLATGSASALAEVMAVQERETALAADHEKLLKLSEDNRVLEKKRHEMETRTAHAARDEKALALKDKLNEALTSRRNLHQAVQESAEARKRLVQLEERRKKQEEARTRAPLWRETHSLLQSRIEAFREFRGEAGRLSSLKDQLVDAEKVATASLEKQDSLLAGEAALEVRKNELQQALSEVRDQESRLGSLDDRRRGLHDLITKRKSLEEQIEARSRLQTRVGQALESRDAAIAGWRELQHLKESSLAGYLAQNLQDSEPCPVCGSLHHPDPNSSAAGLPDEARLEESEQEVRDTEALWADLSAQSASLERGIAENVQEISILEDRLEAGDSENPYRALEELDRHEALHRQLSESWNQLLEVEQPALLLSLRDAAVALEGAQGRQDAIRRNLEERLALWQKAQENRDTNDGTEMPSVEHLDDALIDWKEESEELENRLRNLETGEMQLAGDTRETSIEIREKESTEARFSEEREHREQALMAALSESGIDDEDTLISLIDNAGDVTQERRLIQAWERERNQVKTLLADLHARIDGRDVPDLEATGILCSRRKQEDEVAKDRLASSRASLRRLETIAGELENLEKEGRDAARRQGILLRLSRQARGSIAPKISLKRFFLARRLEEVLIQATRRLSLLSKGRFILRRRDEGRTAAAQAGLDLMIADSWTGTERPVNSLSGGQLFMASLSLALGLADVVQARSGGIRLEALFIDEGFGTLDDDALQGVLKVLNDLRENRMVGVISHVQELRRQIADRIEVSAAEVGSAVRFVTGS